MKTMLITGTTQGIGKAIYERFKNNYDIITVNRRYHEGYNIVCDLTKTDAVADLCKKLSKLEIDILINNAGGAEPVKFDDLSIEELIDCSNLNYHSPVLIMQAVLCNMQKKGYGRIINISSIASKSPRPLIPHYGASKSALEKFSGSLSVAYGNSGICINCISPGGVNTETSIRNREAMAIINGFENSHYNSEIKEKNGIGRMIEPKEVVDLIEFLISDKASAISGQVFNICGTREVH